MHVHRSTSARRSRIFPITISTPYGAVVLAYRVGPDGVASAPFVYHLAPGLHTEAGQKFLQDFRDLDDAISSAWWMSLTDEQRAALDKQNSDWVTPVAPEEVL